MMKKCVRNPSRTLSKSLKGRPCAGCPHLPKPPFSLDDPIIHVFSELQVMRRLPVRLECGVISIDLDEEEQGRILNLLVNIEFMAARLAFEACASVKNETLAK